MLQLKVLGSSSRGNGYIVESESQALVIECGVPFAAVKKALDYNVRKISGCLLTHSHGDHAKYVEQYLGSGIYVYTSHECILQCGLESHRWIPVHPNQQCYLGDFSFIPVELKHDVRCYGWLIRHRGENTFCFITDTHYVPNTFRGLNNIIIECNYDSEILEDRTTTGNIPLNVRQRVLSSHISLDTCRGFLLANDLSKVNNIVLIHLSDGNSDAKRFVSELRADTGKNITIARPGLTIDFNSKPF